MVNALEFYRLRFCFRAAGAVRFPAGKSANVVRGAFGRLLRETAAPAEYARLFEPRAVSNHEADRLTPSGLADWPRPFVFRAAHLDGRTFAPDDEFFFDAHLFDLRAPTLSLFRAAFEEVAQSGLGPGRGRASLLRVEQLDLADAAHILDATPLAPSSLPLDATPDATAEDTADRVTLEFVTPTELKSEGSVTAAPEFAILFARLRDRLSTLRALYGEAPLEIDFRAMGERARSIALEGSDLHWDRTLRRSSRTGQTHAIGGFTGTAGYAGPLTEFLPWLRAARWVGVGRQTVWGKGEVRVHSPRIAIANGLRSLLPRA